ncbi:MULTISPECIES: Hsp20/alpha crystallin family protein [Methylocaldum]|jgi:HSP20 family protein|uniref:Hsp20/alpha crystallin family protein n=1 Tax=unclassified Methylocaldum TaxID=2622260 RepID=UPI000989EF24|nr:MULTISPECIES: Hsp20/alpha crystallin family protein [unclassified Methylocaldum]MBP1151891.1 HSP20 family molecular chaperone IbpA [Methylocaldum sp. RMAD-M]MVF22441.1 Hsp20/alpha crystallin family protein [Methylocaldum sp. BRCS4]
MAETQDVATRQSADVQKPERQVVLNPPVDICEDAEGITLVADMPGVSRDRLNIEVDKNSLLIEGDAHFDMPEGIQALYADIRSTRYRRSFSLSPELEPNNIDATLKDGVLTLKIPKRAELRPRKIEVRVD